MANKTEIVIGGNNTGAKSAIAEVARAVVGLEGNLKMAGKGFAGMFDAKMIGWGAATAAFTGLSLMVKDAINAADEMNKLSQKVGVSVESLSTLKYAADLSDVSIEQLSMGLGKLSIKAVDASRGSDSAKSSFRALGISVTDANGKVKDSNELLLDVADKFSRMEDGSIKTAAAVDIFGRSGKDLIPLLNAGRDGLRDMQDEARALGQEISSNTAMRAEEFNDNLTRLGKVGSGIAMTLANEMLPSLVNVTSGFVELAKDSDTVSIAGQGLGFIFKGVASVFITFYNAIVLVGTGLGTIGAVIAKVLTGDFSGAADAATRGFNMMKNTFSSFQKTFDAVWFGNANEQMSRFGSLTNDAATDTGKLADQWATLEKKLKTDMAQSTMDPYRFSIYQLDQELEDLNNKWGKKQIFADWYSMKLNAIDRKKFSEMASIFDDIGPIQLPITLPPVESLDTGIVDYYKKLSDQQIAESTRVTTMQLADYAIQQEGVNNMFGNMAGAADNFYQLSGQKSKEAFALYKAFSIAQAAISTYTSAVDAYKSMVGIPIIGPGLAVAAAAAAVAFGISNIARISATQPGGGVSGISAGSAPSIRMPSQSTGNGNGTGGGVQITVNVNGGYFDKDAIARDLVPAIEKAYGDGAGGRR